MEYYIKKCQRQELGSIDEDGISHRGRYLLTSMNEQVRRFFPPLTTLEKNDSIFLPIIPMYSMEKVYCNFVYHNDKFHGSTAKTPRNEYRLYLNTKLEQNHFKFKEGDIVIMRKSVVRDGEQVYFLDLLEDVKSVNYIECNNIIANSTIRGASAIYNNELKWFEDKIHMHNANEVTPKVDESIISISKKSDSLNKLFGNPSIFRDFVLVGYDNKCAITGNVIKHENFSNIEAAHIMPKSHEGPYLPSNGIALSRDMHWAFDKGFFTIDEEYKIIVHEKIESGILEPMNGKQIYLPNDEFFYPKKEFLEYHNKHVYGLFLNSGRL